MATQIPTTFGVTIAGATRPPTTFGVTTVGGRPTPTTFGTVATPTNTGIARSFPRGILRAVTRGVS